MNHPVPLRRRAGALLATAGLATAGLVALTAPTATAANAATGSFNWEISQRFDEYLVEHAVASGASENADGVVSFPAVSSSIDPTTGAGTVQYDGSVQAGFLPPMPNPTVAYWVKIEDPAVVVDADGEGRITALVSSAVGAFETPATAARVVVTTFDAADKWTDGSISATPDWDNVAPPGSPQVADYGIAPANQATYPVSGRSFAPSFVTQLVQGVRAHFYYTTATTQDKAPSSFTATYAAAPTVTTSTTYANQTASIKVDGTGFTGTDGNPGDDGVYVGLAPAGGLPDVSTQAGMSAFAAAQWVPASAIKETAFSTTLAAPGSKLDKTKSYAVYTWRAHGHSSTSQDTQTAVTLDWAQLTAPSTQNPPVKGTTTVAGKVTKKPTTRKGGVLKVSLTSTGAAPTGKVTVKLTREGAKAINRQGAIKGGAAVVKLPKLKAGAWKATITYAGSDALDGSSKVVKIKVAKATKKK